MILVKIAPHKHAFSNMTLRNERHSPIVSTNQVGVLVKLMSKFCQAPSNFLTKKITIVFQHDTPRRRPFSIVLAVLRDDRPVENGRSIKTRVLKQFRYSNDSFN